MSKVSPEAAKAVYAGLEPTEQVSILRRSCLGLGQRPGSEKLADVRTTLLLERDFGTAPQPELAALLLSGLNGRPAAAAEILFRFKTKGVKSGSEKWQRRQDAAAAVQTELEVIDASFAAEVDAALSKKK